MSRLKSVLIQLSIVVFLLIITFILSEKYKEQLEDTCNADYKCLNGGKCLAGQCHCTLQYTGHDCSIRKPPNSVTIHRIEISGYPDKNYTQGREWDTLPAIDSRPDVFISLNQGFEVNRMEYTSTTYNNVSDSIVVFKDSLNGFPLVLHNIGDEEDFDYNSQSGYRIGYTLGIWDYDPEFSENHAEPMSTSWIDFQAHYAQNSQDTILVIAPEATSNHSFTTTLYISWEYSNN